MVNFLIDNIYVEFGGVIFQQTIGIPMGTNCAPLLADLFLYTYEAEFIKKLLAQKQKNIAQSFNFTYRYIDDVLSLSNSDFDQYIHTIYPPELDIKNTTDSTKSSSYLDLLLSIDANTNLHTKLYDKRDDFDFHIVNFPFLDSNIPLSPAYGVYISQLIRFARACTEYTDFIDRSKILTSKLLNQGYKSDRLKVAIKKCVVDILTFLAYLVNLYIGVVSHSLLMIYYKFPSIMTKTSIMTKSQLLLYNVTT